MGLLVCLVKDDLTFAVDHEALAAAHPVHLRSRPGHPIPNSAKS